MKSYFIKGVIKLGDLETFFVVSDENGDTKHFEHLSTARKVAQKIIKGISPRPFCYLMSNETTTKEVVSDEWYYVQYWKIDEEGNPGVWIFVVDSGDVNKIRYIKFPDKERAIDCARDIYEKEGLSTRVIINKDNNLIEVSF